MKSLISIVLFLAGSLFVQAETARLPRLAVIYVPAELATQDELHLSLDAFEEDPQAFYDQIADNTEYVQRCMMMDQSLALADAMPADGYEWRIPLPDAANRDIPKALKNKCGVRVWVSCDAEEYLNGKDVNFEYSISLSLPTEQYSALLDSDPTADIAPDTWTMHGKTMIEKGSLISVGAYSSGDNLFIVLPIDEHGKVKLTPPDA